MEKTDSQLLYHFWRYEKQCQCRVLENTVEMAAKRSLEHSRAAITTIAYFNYYDAVMFCVIAIIRCL